MEDEQVKELTQKQNQPTIGEDKGSRNAFPRISLKKVLALPKMIFELGEGDPVPRLVVFDKLGKSPGSGPSRMLITTSSSYGLTTGGYQAERLGITDLGKAVVSTGGQSLTDGIMKVLFSNDLFSKFYEKYKGKGVPSEPIAVDALKQLGGLNEKDAKASYEIFMENLEDYGFIQEFSGKPTIVTQDLLNIDASNEGVTLEKSSGVVDKGNSNQEPTHQELTKFGQKQLVPQFNFNIQIQLPEDATPEQYDAIFKSMSEHLLTLREG